ncbi:MAG: ECF-type sigma factor, partial [Phycisphaerales bacterium]
MTRRRDRQPGPEPRSSDRTVLGLIKDLQAGHVSGGALAAGDRRRVVEHLWAEGYSVPEIAEVVKATERTVHRDRQAIRQANALDIHDGLVPEMVGGLVRQAEVAIGRLRRVARDRETAAATKV